MKNGTGNRWALGMVLGLAVCMGLGAFVSRAATGVAMSKPPAAITIATVDLEEILKGLHERESKEKALTAKQEEYKAKVKALEEELKNDKAKFDAEPEGPSKVAMKNAIREKVYRAEFEGQYAGRVLKEMQVEMLRDLFLKINGAVQFLAKRDGYQLVLTSDDKAPVNSTDPDGVLRAIAQKRILYVDPALDITADVVTYLNNQFDAGVTAPAGAPAAKPGKTP